LHVYVDELLQRLAEESPLPFSALFTPPRNRGRLVGLFLAVLELIKARQAVAEQPEPFAEIHLARLAEEPQCA
jgi:chromatin segregation and condensation protein Rec8/ScpA/Scc1 (kleisin family)